MRYQRVVLLTLVMSCFLLASCAVKQPGEPIGKEESLGVAEFMQPKHEWEFLSAFRQGQEDEAISKKVLDNLNSMLKEELKKADLEPYQKMSTVQQCKEIVLFEEKGYELTGMEFWTKVGRCMSVDYLLIPQVREWQQRKGGEWGVEKPAKVVFDLFLLDLKSKSLAKRFHFDKKQEALTDDLLQLKSFIKRGGKWIEAETLAREGLSQGLKELGL